MTISAFAAKDDPTENGNVISFSYGISAFRAMRPSHKRFFSGNTIDDNVKERTKDSTEHASEHEEEPQR